MIDAADTNDNTTDDNGDDEPPSLERIEDEDEDSGEEGVDDGGGRDDGHDDEDDDKDDDAWDDLTEEEREVLMENAASVRATLDKVCLKLLYSSMNTDILIDKIRRLSFAIIHSTTIALPAWHKACTANSRPIRLIPRDVKTRWNSTYDMLTVAFDYRTVIDDITANKSLKLRRYELDDQDWEVVEDLLRVLKVCFFFATSSYNSTYGIFRCIRMRLFFSLRTMPSPSPM